MKSLLIIFALCLTTVQSLASTCVSLGNGDWNDPLRWSCGAVPAPGDTIIINAGDTVTLNSTEILNGAPMLIVVNGYFLFDTPAAKLHLECGSEVVVSPTGEIASSGVGQPSHNIKICGQEVWQGFDGPLLGPVILSGPLPIELVYFNANQIGVTVTATWETASEYNNDYFTLQGSNDGIYWSDLKDENGAGTTDQTQYYTMDFDNRMDDFGYFRLRQTDYNGSSTFSDVVSVTRLQTAELTVFPNPVNTPYLSLSWNSEIEHAQLEILDINGRLIDSRTDLQNGQHLINTEAWQPGCYIVNITSDFGTESVRLIKP